MIKITTEAIPGSKVIILRLSGVMDSADNNEFSKKMQEETSKGNYFFIADMTNVSYINSSGILDLLCSKEQLKKYKGVIKFYGFSQNVHSILEVLGLLKLINVYDNIEDCQRSISYLLNK